MQPTIFTVTKDEWILVTDSASGSLYLQEGHDVALAQATTKPTSEITDTALLDRLSNRQNFLFLSSD